MAQADAVGVTHYDIKPRNVRLTTRNGVKLIDFGNARFNDEKPPRGTKPYYPQIVQEQGIPEMYNKMDVSAFGMIIFEIYAATGVTKYGTQRYFHENETKTKHQYTNPCIFEDLISNCELPERRLRPSFIEIVKEILSQVDMTVIDYVQTKIDRIHVSIRAIVRGCLDQRKLITK